MSWLIAVLIVVVLLFIVKHSMEKTTYQRVVKSMVLNSGKWMLRSAMIPAAIFFVRRILTRFLF